MIRSKKLYLVNPVISVEEKQGLSLSEFIKQIKSDHEDEHSSIALFSEKLSQAGYHPIHEEFYENNGMSCDNCHVCQYILSNTSCIIAKMQHQIRNEIAL